MHYVIFLVNKNRGAGNSASLLLLAALFHVLFSPFVSFGVSQFMGYLKGKIAIIIFDDTAIYKYKFGLNKATIAKYIREQDK